MLYLFKILVWARLDTAEGSGTRKGGDGSICAVHISKQLYLCLESEAAMTASSPVSCESLEGFMWLSLDYNNQTQDHFVIKCDIIYYTTGVSGLWIWLSNIPKVLTFSRLALRLFNVWIAFLCLHVQDRWLACALEVVDSFYRLLWNILHQYHPTTQ